MLPLFQPQEEESLEIIDEDLPSETNSNSWKILIVDDEEEVHQSSKWLIPIC